VVSGAPAAWIWDGWDRLVSLEFGTPEQPDLAWTTAAVLRPLAAPTPGDSPIALDGASSGLPATIRSASASSPTSPPSASTGFATDCGGPTSSQQRPWCPGNNYDTAARPAGAG